MKFVLDIKDKTFTSKQIFSNTKFEISDGQMIAIVGESGIGKSTLLKMIGLLEPFVGEYQIDGNKIVKKNLDKTRNNIFSYLFQDPMLVPYLNVFENIVLPLKNMKKDIEKELVIHLAKTLNIEPLLYRSIKKLSGGELNRVAIARALIADKPVILCDEPTGNLDDENAEIVMNLLKEQKALGKTVIVVTHSNYFNNYYDFIYRIKNKEILNDQ